MMQVAGEQPLQRILGIGTFEAQHSHVGDVEHADPFANGLVFLDQAAELNRHLPAGKRHHAAPGAAAGLEQGSALQGHGGGGWEAHSYGGLHDPEGNPEICPCAWSVSQTVTSLSAFPGRLFGHQLLLSQLSVLHPACRFERVVPSSPVGGACRACGFDGLSPLDPPFSQASCCAEQRRW